MNQPIIKYYLNRLQEDNYKSFYLAVLRVAISMWLLKELIINWPYMDLLYGQSAFVELKANVLNRLPGGISFVRQYYWWFIIPYTVVILMNIAGIGRRGTALLLFLFQYVLQQMNYTVLNGGDVMVRLILFYLVFANSYHYFVLFKEEKNTNLEEKKLQNLISNLAAFSIMFQLCLTYFLSGMEKLMDPIWWNGEGTYYALSMERFIGTPYNQSLVQYKWFNLITNYFTIALELSFPFLIWIKKFRKPLLIAGIIFHLSIYVFMMIYGFQIVFILMYGLFLPNDRLLHFAQRMKQNGERKKIITDTTIH